MKYRLFDEILAEYDPEFEYWAEEEANGRPWQEVAGDTEADGLAALGRCSDALATVSAGSARHGVSLLRIGECFSRTHNSEYAQKCYEEAGELAPNPRVQFEIGCLLLLRCGVARDELAYFYPIDSPFEWEPSLETHSQLHEELIPYEGPRFPALLRPAVVALARASRGIYHCHTSGEAQRLRLFDGADDVELWCNRSLLALGVGFALDGKPDCAIYIHEWLLDLGVPEASIPPSIVLAAYGQPIANPEAKGALVDVVRRLDRQVWLGWASLDSQARSNLATGEVLFWQAQNSLIPYQPCVTAYANAFEAQLRATLARLGHDQLPKQLGNVIGWLDKNAATVGTGLTQTDQDFLLREVPRLYREEIKGVRVRADHSDRSGEWKPIEAHEAQRLRHVLVDRLQEGSAAVMRRLVLAPHESLDRWRLEQ